MLIYRKLLTSQSLVLARRINQVNLVTVLDCFPL